MPDAPFSPETALQSAVVAAWRGDATLLGLLGGAKVYDEIPADAGRPAPPWIYAGPIGTTLVDLAQGTVWRVRSRFYCASVDFGRLGCWAIARAARRAVHAKDLPIEGGFTRLGPLLVVALGDVVEAGKPKEVFLDVQADLTEDQDIYPPGEEPA